MFPEVLDAVQPLKLASTIEVTVGEAEVVTVKEPAVPVVNDPDAALVIVGDVPRVSVKVWVALVPTPLEAVRQKM